jgi:predicted chitinase
MENNERALTQAQQIGNAFNDLSDQMYLNSDSREHAVEKLAAQLDELNKSIEQSGLASSDEVAFHLQQLKQTQLLFTSLNEDLAFIKYQLKHIIESRSSLLASLQKMAEPSDTEDVTSQTDIELF